MKAVTIIQPRAELLMRSEHPIISHRFKPSEPGRILIHASSNREHLTLNEKQTVDYPSGIAVAQMNFGEIIGAADYVGFVIRARKILSNAIQKKYPWLAKHPQAAGPYIWILENLVRFAKPIPYKGSPDLWTYRGLEIPEEPGTIRPVSECDLEDSDH